MAIRMMTTSDDELVQELCRDLREGLVTMCDPRRSSLFPAVGRDRVSGRVINSTDTRDRLHPTGNNNCDVLPLRKYIICTRPYKQIAPAMREILGDVESIDGLRDVCHAAYGRPDVDIVHTLPEFGYNGTRWCTATVQMFGVLETVRLIADNLHFDQVMCDTSNSSHDDQYSSTSVRNDRAWHAR